MIINFSKNAWDTKDITYAYSYRFEEIPTFVQKENCIENRRNSDAIYGFDNISLLTKEQYGPLTHISTHCAFEDLGAPLIVIADKLYTDSRGVVRYGDYLEIVLYKNGINVWRMWLENGEVTWKQLMGVEFPVSETDVHSLSVEIGMDSLQIETDDKKMLLHVENMFTSYHVGINACEGINRFYDLEIAGPVMKKY